MTNVIKTAAKAVIENDNARIAAQVIVTAAVLVATHVAIKKIEGRD